MPFPNIRHWFAPHTTPAPSHSLADTETSAQHIQEQINPTALASSPTQEDWYWGRLATGSEEDYYWRRLSARLCTFLPTENRHAALHLSLHGRNKPSQVEEKHSCALFQRFL